MPGPASPSRVRPSATCRRNPTSPASRPPLAYVRPASTPTPPRPTTTPPPPARRPRPHRRRGPRDPVRRRGPPRRPGPHPGAARPTSCCSTSRPTTSTCPASNGWSGNWPACAPASSSSATTGGCWSACRAPRSGSTAASPARSTAGSPPSSPGATRCWSRRKPTATSSAARSRWRRTGCATASPPGASATRSGSPTCTRLRERRREHRAAAGKVRMEAAGADLSGRLVAVAENVSNSYGDRPIVRDFSTRILRGDRVGIVGAERRRQDHAAQPADRRAGARQRARCGSAPTWRRSRLDQRRETLDPAQTLRQALTGGAGDTVTVGGADPPRGRAT